MAQVLAPIFANKFKKQFKKLSPSLQERFTKKLPLLLSNPRHPSFYARKMGRSDTFEARLSLHYRFTYVLVENETNELWFLTIGTHDVGLGKK